MEIDRVCKYCHVSAYVAYDNCDPVYKKTFKFEISPGSHNSLVWDKIIKLFTLQMPTLMELTNLSTK